MITLNITGKEYKIKYGYNSFCDTDLLDRTNDLLLALQKSDATSDKDVSALGQIKEMFCCVRDLLFVGFEKYNPVESVQNVGNLLDDYHDEAQEGETRGILDLFLMLTTELMNEGFLADLMNQMEETPEEKIKAIPQDHKRKK